ncbi:MAG: 2-oxo acid dehydrogenase subunit E2, partial [Verrucomicrobiota bacterium]|nr:2-oxo acid dehydrogenase subunit E2 [Verrucomicrobiota bacterium]
KIDDTVEIGQELGTILTEEGEPVSAPQQSNGAAKKRSGRTSQEIEPALSPTIVRKLSRVVSTNLQIDARWDAIQKARAAAKKSDRQNAASPSAMIAWAVVRVMEKHAPFRRLMLDDDQIVEQDPFDLGIAVAIEGDRLATAVITHANTREWPDFVRRYHETVEETRTGRVDAMNAPLVISSLGAFGVRAGAPIVVPPSVGTLFVGSAHKDEGVEVITLSLTFDHRVVNGAGAASFARDIKDGIECFEIPKKAPATTR